VKRLLWFLLFLPRPCWADGVFGVNDSSSVGTTTVESNVRLSGTMVAPEDGYVDSIQWWMRVDQVSATTDDSGVCCLYRVEGDNDTVCIGTSDIVVFPYADDYADTLWVSFPFTPPIQIMADSIYLFGAHASASSGTINVRLDYEAGKTVGRVEGVDFDGTCDESLVLSSSSENYTFSARAYYSDGEAPPPSAMNRRRRMLLQ